MRLDTIAINASTITAGTVHIYRPTARVDAPRNLWMSVVNNTGTPQTLTYYFNGKAAGTVSLDASNTAGSYRFLKVFSTGSGSVTWQLGVGGSKITLDNAAGYEVYLLNGKPSLRTI